MHLISQTRREMVQKTAIHHPVWTNTESSAPKVELGRKTKKQKTKKKTSTTVVLTQSQTAHRRDQGRVQTERRGWSERNNLALFFYM